MKRVTIYDVAKDAKVSLATVSRVINGSDVVKEPTRIKVEESIQRLGYKPNAIAQGLALQKTTTIGLVIPEASFTYTGQIINGLIDVAKIYNYKIILHTITEGIRDINDTIDEIIKSRVDGVIIYNDRITSNNVEELTKYNIPIVFIGNPVKGEHICSVYVDIERAISELCSSYLAKGVNDIKILQDRKNSNATNMMLNGINKSYNDNLNHMIEIPSDYRSTYKFMKEYFKDHRHDLVIAHRDSQAMAVLNACKENGINIPQDMELVCIIDTKYNSMVRPEISSFEIPSYDLGAVSMRVMTKMLENEVVHDKKLSYIFTPRNSTK